MPLSPGARLGSYDVVSLLGAGGMGEVYRVRDPRLHHPHIVTIHLRSTVTNDIVLFEGLR